MSNVMSQELMAELRELSYGLDRCASSIQYIAERDEGKDYIDLLLILGEELDRQRDRVTSIYTKAQLTASEDVVSANGYNMEH